MIISRRYIERLRQQQSLIQPLLDYVAHSFGITNAELTGSHTGMDYSNPRHVAMWLLHRRYKLSLQQTALLLGRVNHTSAMYAVSKFKPTDPHYDGWLADKADQLFTQFTVKENLMKTDPMFPSIRLTVDFHTNQGNIFELLSLVRSTLIEAGHNAEARLFIDQAFALHEHDAIIALARTYIHLKLSGHKSE